MRPTVIEVNCETGKEIERAMTDKEFAHYESLKELSATETE